MTGPDTRLADAKAIPIVEVAQRLGIEGLRREGHEHVGPCPDCGGRDRFGINPSRQVFNCRQCGAAGDGLALVQHVHGCDFKGALAFLVGEASAEVDPAEVERRRKRAAAAEARRQEAEAAMRARAIRDGREIWHAAERHDPAPARAYLAGRGIRLAAWPPTLRFLPDHPYRLKIAGQMQELHRGPCMVAAVQGADGRVRAVHQTWIDLTCPGEKARITGPDGEPRPAKLVRGSKKGGAIRLSPMKTGGALVVGEGIETTASALVAGVLPGATFWAGVDLGNMAGRQLREVGRRHSGRPDLGDADAWLPPRGLRLLVFLQDGDSDPKATRAKLLCGLRRAQHHNPGLTAEIVAAPAGKDFNDVLRDRDHDTDRD